MFHSSAVARDILLVDIEDGVVLQSPPEVRVSERYVDSHPFIRYTGAHVVVGPDADRVADGAGGENYLLYEVIGRDIGALYLRREA